MVGYRGDSASKNVVNGDMYNESVRSLLPGLSQLILHRAGKNGIKCFFCGMLYIGRVRERGERERERESERYR